MSFAGAWKREITVDLSHDRIATCHLEAFQGDKRANKWIVTILDNGNNADLTGFSATAYFIRPDGNTVSVSGTISGNKVTVELDSHVYVYIGRVTGTLVISATDYAVTIDAMNLNVLKRNTDVITPDDDNFVVIGSGTLDTSAQTVVGAINELNSDFESIVAITNSEIDALFT